MFRLLGELSSYLDSFGSAMTYSREDYASPSGINMPELLEIQRLLLSQPEPADEQQQRTRLAAIVEKVQSGRAREGLPLVAQSSRII